MISWDICPFMSEFLHSVWQYVYQITLLYIWSLYSVKCRSYLSIAITENFKKIPQTHIRSYSSIESEPSEKNETN